MKKRICIILTVLLVCASLFATTATYNFEITGKTQEQFLRDKLEIPKKESFDSFDDAIKQIDHYKQKMVNLRLFKECNYDFEYNTETDSLNIVFHITDAKSMVILPYPKYDSNTGLLLKIKGVDKNFMGSLAEVNAGLIYENDDGQNSAGLSLTTEGLELGRVTVDGSFESMVNINSLKESTIDLNVTARTKTEHFSIVPELSLEVSGFTKNDAAEIVTAVGFEDINYLPVVFNFKPSISTFGKKVMYLRSELSAKYKQFEASDDLIKYTKSSKNALSNDFIFGYNVDAHIFPYFEMNTFLSKTDSNTRYNELSMKVRYKNQFEGFNYTITAGDTERIYAGPKPTINYLTASLEATRNEINYIFGNFRQGFSLSFDSSVRHTVGKKDSVVFDYFRFRGQAIWFPLYNNVFNPSVRVTVSASTDPFKSYLETYKDGCGYGFNYLNDDVENITLLAEYMRGTRNDNSVALKISEQQAFITANINLMMKFITLGNFADTYINPFCDFTIMTKYPKQISKFEIDRIATVGIEGIGIRKNYPAYPIRASLGFDLDKLCSWLGTRKGLPEYEIYIGLYHFF